MCPCSVRTHVVVVALLLGLLQVVGPAEVAAGLNTHHVAVPGRRAQRGQSEQLLVGQVFV